MKKLFFLLKGPEVIISKIELEKLEKIVEPLAQSNGLEIVDLEYVGANAILRVYIDKLDRDGEGITVDDCATLSRIVSDIIDVEFSQWTHHYNLEVSSPGLERVIKKDRDFLRFQGSKIKVKTFAPIEGQRKFKGVLDKFEDGALYLGLDEGTVKIEKKNIAKANLLID
jgi:ribosome maturation factor RimP